MDDKSAKQIGSREALKSVGIGLFIAQIMMTAISYEDGLLQKLLWFLEFEYKLNLVIGIVLMLLCGHLFGKRAGLEILIKGRNFIWTGFKYGLLTLVTTVFLVSLIEFFREGIRNIGTNDEPITDYILKPVFWVLIFGFIPALLVSFWFGKQIKKRGNHSTHYNS